MSAGEEQSEGEQPGTDSEDDSEYVPDEMRGEAQEQHHMGGDSRRDGRRDGDDGTPGR
jgi:hypothetical protein